jgi:hypothetical protein
MSGRRQQLAREVRARLQQHRELEWAPLPAWFLGGDADIVAPINQQGGNDTAAMATVTKADYLAALKAAVEARDVGPHHLEPEIAERSWERFLAYRDQRDHGPHCECPDDARRYPRPAPTPRPSAGPVVRAWSSEGGPRQTRDLESERAHDERSSSGSAC